MIVIPAFASTIRRSVDKNVQCDVLQIDSSIHIPVVLRPTFGGKSSFCLEQSNPCWHIRKYCMFLKKQTICPLRLQSYLIPRPWFSAYSQSISSLNHSRIFRGFLYQLNFSFLTISWTSPCLSMTKIQSRSHHCSLYYTCREKAINLQWLPWIGIKSFISLLFDIFLNSLFISISNASHKISIWPECTLFPEIRFKILPVIFPNVYCRPLLQNSDYLTYWYWWFHRNEHMKMIFIWIHCLDFKVVFLWNVK